MKPVIASLVGFGIVVAYSATAFGGVPYLPLIGPPPMRLLTIRHIVTPAPVKPAANPTLTASNSPTVAATKPENSVVETKPIVEMERPVEKPVMIAPVTTDQSLGQSLATSIFTLPTPDLLGISPETLASYFRPIQHGTNSPSMIGVFPITFMPPSPPDKSSHAEYIVK